jgi:hypothetical protein
MEIRLSPALPWCCIHARIIDGMTDIQTGLALLQALGIFAEGCGCNQLVQSVFADAAVAQGFQTAVAHIHGNAAGAMPVEEAST